MRIFRENLGGSGREEKAEKGTWLSGSVTIGLAAGGDRSVLPGQAMALDEVSFGTNWLAEGEHGGFYQAVADGTYEKYGLKVTIVQGGPQAANLALPNSPTRSSSTWPGTCSSRFRAK